MEKNKKKRPVRSRRSRHYHNSPWLIALALAMAFLLAFLAGIAVFNLAKSSEPSVPPISAPANPVAPVVVAPAEKPVVKPLVPPAPVVATKCVDPDKLARMLNAAHAKDPNEPVSVMMYLQPFVKNSFRKGDRVVSDPNGTIIVLRADLDPRHFIKVSSDGVLVALMGGANATIYGAYDGTWIMPENGFVVSTCSRLNPSNDLYYWGK